jgi:hypothetical protein
LGEGPKDPETFIPSVILFPVGDAQHLDAEGALIDETEDISII